MRLSPEGARWLICLRWLACVHIFAAVWLTSAVLGVVVNPWPLYAVGCGVVAYNVWFQFTPKDWADHERNVEGNIFQQIVLDLVSLTLLLYFADISRNPFLFYFVFHMVIASMYLHGWAPYFMAGLSTVLVGGVMSLEQGGWIRRFALHFPSDPPGGGPIDGLFLFGVFVAFASTVWFTVYFTTSLHGFVDRAHAEIRQKEKMLGIGQLVAGMAHQIANPLDGVQNCLRTIGEGVKNDAHLTEYVQLMGEALERIERTATRVQAFARPHGIELQSTDVNAAVQAMLGVLGTDHGQEIRIETDLGDVPPVRGDTYTLQEVLFNLCANALAAMPDGGTLTITTRGLPRQSEDRWGSVAIEVSDTGHGIPRSEWEKVFEPFYTTRADSGGTGLGLGLCRMLISEMGGRIEVRSTLHQGTVFTVVLHRNAASARSTGP